MSAREPFFPRAPKLRSTPTFVADQSNPLHRSASSSQESSALAPLDKLDNNQHSGLDDWMRSSSRDSAPRKASRSGVRPATADPFRSIQDPLAQEGQNPVLAPAPKRLGQVSPPLMSGDGMPATEDTTSHSLISSGSSNEDHISHIVRGRNPHGSKNPFMKKAHGPQRIMVEDAPHYRPRSIPAGATSANNVEDQSSLPVSRLIGRKRMREIDAVGDDDTVIRQAKRFKNQELGHDKIVERPSSGLSSIASAHHRPEVQGHAQPQRFVHDQQDHFEPSSFVHDQQDHFEPSFTPSNGMQSEHSNIIPSDMRGLDRLLGPGSNDYLEQHIEKYEESLKKWSECSLDEWKAGAEKMSAQFTKIIDFVKSHVENKLNAYNEVNAILESHEETLRERNKTIELTQKKLVEDGENVLS